MDLKGLSGVCSDLGYKKDGVYIKGEFCLDCLKDLQRFLRRDDPQTRDVFKHLCKWNTVSEDLIPIIEQHQNDRDLVINAVKIMVFLTMPMDPDSDDISQQIEYLWGLKAAITRQDTIAVIVSLLEDPLENLEREAFTEDDWKLVQLVLTLFRNLLAIQDITLQQKASGCATQFLSLRDRFLELLFHENVMDLILVLAQHVAGTRSYLRQDNLLLLETFHHIFLGQEPELIARASLEDSKADGDIKRTLNSLRFIMEEEEEKRRLIRQRNLDWYSQFSGTFTRLGMDGSKTVCKGSPAAASGDSLIKAHKVQRGPLKRIAWDKQSLSLPKGNVLQILHDFINQFLSGGYNVLMQSIRKDIEKEHHAIQTSDVIVFFQVAHFVTAFQHHKFSISKRKTDTLASEESSFDKSGDGTLFRGAICGPIAATMNESMFSLVISKWRSAFDALKETNDYKFLSVAGTLMKDMIHMLDLVLKVLPENSKEPQTARILLYKIFYDQTDQGMTQFLVNLIKSFDTHKQPKSDLADLVEMMHIVLRLMENIQARGTLRVAKKSRKDKKKKRTVDGIATDAERLGEADASVLHTDVRNLESGDAIEEQVVELNQSEKENLINSGFDGKEESNSLSAQIEKADKVPLDANNLGDDQDQMDKGKLNNDVNDMAYGTDTSEDDQPPAKNEVDFNVSKFVATFANNTVIQNLCWLLRFYKSNSATTNHYIIRMLQRICDDLERYPMLYQLSLLTTFYEILNDQKSFVCDEYANIVSFLTKLVRKLLKEMKTQPLLFVEILFWKTQSECHYSNLRKEIKSLRRFSADAVKTGTFIGNEGLFGRNIADSLGEDEADIVISHEPSHSFNEHLFEDGAEKASKRKQRSIFDQQQEASIKDLYEKYKDNRQCSRLIAEALDPEGKIAPVQVSAKLKQLGLKVASKKRIPPVDGPLSGGHDQSVLEDRPLASPDTAGRSSNELEDVSFPRSSSHTRKRVRVFSKEQEQMLRDLFEQFKNHKRCSHMIANALDADNTYTAAQVSHKLKQLGLRVPQQRKQHEAEKQEQSAEETLVSMRKRGKSKPKTEVALPPEEDSDDETLSTMLERSGKRVLPKLRDNMLKTDSLRDAVTDSELASVASHNLAESDASAPPIEMEPSHKLGTDAEELAHLDDHLEVDLASTSGVQDVFSTDKPAENEYHLRLQKSYDELANELADSDGEVAPVVRKNVGSRKFKMVIDPEDDD